MLCIPGKEELPGTPKSDISVSSLPSTPPNSKPEVVTVESDEDIEIIDTIAPKRSKKQPESTEEEGIVSSSDVNFYSNSFLLLFCYNKHRKRVKGIEKMIRAK